MPTHLDQLTMDHWHTDPLPKYQGTEVVDKDRFGGHEQVLKQLGPTINLCAFSLLLSPPGLRT